VTEHHGGPLENYRQSHSAPGYGKHYSRTYQEGYFARLWHEIERPLLERRIGEVAAHGGSSALDFACGTGRITAVLTSRFQRVVGVDVSSAMLEVARAECQSADFRQQDITKEPLQEQFDLATAFRFFLNAEPGLRSSAMDAIRQAVRPGGWLITNIHVTDQSPLGIAYRARNAVLRRTVANTLSLDSLADLGARHEFDVVHVDWYGFMPRIGNLTDGLLLSAMAPAERLFRALPLLPRRLAQAVLVTFRRR